MVPTVKKKVQVAVSKGKNRTVSLTVFSFFKFPLVHGLNFINGVTEDSSTNGNGSKEELKSTSPAQLPNHVLPICGGTRPHRLPQAVFREWFCVCIRQFLLKTGLIRSFKHGSTSIVSLTLEYFYFFFTMKVWTGKSFIFRFSSSFHSQLYEFASVVIQVRSSSAAMIMVTLQFLPVCRRKTKFFMFILPAK